MIQQRSWRPRQIRSIPPPPRRPSSPAAVLNLMPFAMPSALHYGEVWKIANEALTYPNAELVRKALVNVLPNNSIVLVAHDHFGVDLSPGLSIKLNSGFVSDVLAIEGVEGTSLKVVRQEFGGAGKRSRSLRYFIRRSDQRPSGGVQAPGQRPDERDRRRQIIRGRRARGGKALRRDGRR